MVSFQMKVYIKDNAPSCRPPQAHQYLKRKRARKLTNKCHETKSALSNVEVLLKTIIKIHLYKPTKLKLDNQFPKWEFDFHILLWLFP